MNNRSKQDMLVNETNTYIWNSYFHAKHIHLKGATPVGKLCVSAVKMRCDLLTTSLKQLASFESLGRRCFTLKPSMALIRKESKRIKWKNAINRAS